MLQSLSNLGAGLRLSSGCNALRIRDSTSLSIKNKLKNVSRRRDVIKIIRYRL